MAAECQGARRACSHLALAVDRLADQVPGRKTLDPPTAGTPDTPATACDEMLHGSCGPQVAHQQSIIDSLITNVNDAEAEKVEVVHQAQGAQKALALSAMRRWVSKGTTGLMRDALVTLQQEFTRANVDAAKDSVNRQRSQEEELAAIKEDCEKVCATTLCAMSEPFN